MHLLSAVFAAITTAALAPTQAGDAADTIAVTIGAATYECALDPRQETAISPEIFQRHRSELKLSLLSRQEAEGRGLAPRAGEQYLAAVPVVIDGQPQMLPNVLVYRKDKALSLGGFCLGVSYRGETQSNECFGVGLGPFSLGANHDDAPVAANRCVLREAPGS